MRAKTHVGLQFLSSDFNQTTFEICRLDRRKHVAKAEAELSNFRCEYTQKREATNKQTNEQEMSISNGRACAELPPSVDHRLQPKFPACLTSLLVSSCSLIKFRQERFDRRAFYLPEPQHFNKTSTRTHANLIKRHIFRCAFAVAPGVGRL